MNNLIKLLVMDVDGTLTDGKINISANGELFKSFSVKDGYAIGHILKKNKILSAVITGRKSDIVTCRAKELNIDYLYQGIAEKLPKMLQLAEELHISASEIAYIGDDLNDLDCLKAVGIAACPADAVDGVKVVCDYICTKNGGDGAVREFIEWLVE